MTFDANGNLTSITEPSGLTTFTWDARNRLVGIGNPNTTASFVYDPTGRRTRKQANADITQYVYDGADIVWEMTNGNPIAYLRSLNIDEAFSRGDQEFYLADALGSTIGLADPLGAVVTTYTYEPFGHTAATGSFSTNSFQFTGRENDIIAGFHYYRARYYSPLLHRFVAEDTLALSSGDPNFYAYVLNSPLRLTDPTGELFNLGTAAAGALVGSAVGVWGALVTGGDIGSAALQGAVVGAITGGTLGAGLPVLTAAGRAGLAAFDFRLWAQNISNFLAGRKQSPWETIDRAFNQGVITTVTTAAAGGLGRLAGDIGVEISPGFGSFVERYFSAGVSAISSMGQGLGRVAAR